MKVAVIFGTRPEAIKMAPVVYALRDLANRGESLCPAVFVSGQHREMLNQVLSFFAIQPDADLEVMRPGQGLGDLTARLLTGLQDLLAREAPDLVLVHGDTTTAFAASLAAYYQRIPVGHVEAGLRTHNRYSPFPEEMNRQLVDGLATYHFAPTQRAVANLQAEGISSEHICLTGNTVIDALLLTLDRLGEEGAQLLVRRCPELSAPLAERRRIVLVTSHRRENFGPGLIGICQALVDLTRRFRDVTVVYPVHPNPNVRATTERYLANREHINLVAPLDYNVFCYLMSRCHLILTDSGGIQEEAPTLHKPVLVLRDTSERPEAVEAGAARLVGVDRDCVVEAASRLLTDEADYARMAGAGNPYGDGRAASRIADFVSSLPLNGRAANDLRP